MSDKEKSEPITSFDGSGLPGWGLEDAENLGYVTTGFMATEEALKEALENPGVLTTSTNMEAFTAPIEAEQQMMEMKRDFRDFVNNLPRKLKRKVYEEKKFGNRLEATMRGRRLAAQKGNS